MNSNSLIKNKRLKRFQKVPYQYASTDWLIFGGKSRRNSFSSVGKRFQGPQRERVAPYQGPNSDPVPRRTLGCLGYRAGAHCMQEKGIIEIR